MKYNVRYWDRTGSGLPFNEDIELSREYTNEEHDLFVQELKKEIVNKLGNIVQESDIKIKSWIQIE